MRGFTSSTGLTSGLTSSSASSALRLPLAVGDCDGGFASAAEDVDGRARFAWNWAAVEAICTGWYSGTLGGSVGVMRRCMRSGPSRSTMSG